MNARFNFFSLLVAILFSFGCKKEYTCECVDYYTGADTSWTNVKGERDFLVKKEEEAVAQCDELDGTPQIYYTEEYGLDCELK